MEGRLWMGCFECPSIPVRFIRGIPGLDGLPSSDDDKSDAMLLELPFDSVARDIECDIGILWPITCAFVGGVELTSILGQRSNDDSIQGVSPECLFPQLVGVKTTQDVAVKSTRHLSVPASKLIYFIILFHT